LVFSSRLESDVENIRLHEILGRPAILMGVAGLMTGKKTTIVKNVQSAGEKRFQKHHKFKKDYRFFVYTSRVK
jgi:hypothetical protein